MINKIVLATNNKHKLEEFNSMFASYNVEVISLKDAGIVCDPEENGKTFKDNSLIKAKEVANFTKYPVISDDSGLVIKSLDGFPGVYSARFMEGYTYEEKRMEIIKKLSDFKDKSARFETVLCLYNLENEPLYFNGFVEGKIVLPSGDNGFAYDPIFYCNELNKTFGDATSDEKNKVSHRSRALKKLIDYLIDNKYIEK